ncbi:HTH_Tnp_Tc3_2 domain-containing protein [Trichonephila clavipes]|nr:HTH_Tnp_Tc3_2 domain-containing protein [Trichonephila clavipes]
MSVEYKKLHSSVVQKVQETINHGNHSGSTYICYLNNSRKFVKWQINVDIYQAMKISFNSTSLNMVWFEKMHWAGRRAVLLARWIVRSVPLEIVGSSGHEKVPTCGKPGLERPGRPRGDRIEGSCDKLLWTPVTRSTRRADVGVAIVPQTISRHLAEANLKSERLFPALPLTPEHRQLRLQWYQAR